MKKKMLSLIMSVTMTTAMLSGCGSSSESTDVSQVVTEEVNDEEVATSSAAAGDYDLTLYTVNSTDTDFGTWLDNVQDATGLKINVIAAPTDTDTRQQKITTILSTGDTSVDIIEINDEMSASFKNTGWLEGLNDTVMTEDIRDEFPTGYVNDMITDKNGQIIGVPGYSGYLAFWVNQEIMDQVGISSIDTKEDFLSYMEKCKEAGIYGYGGSWEKTYAFNEIAQFVNMFGGDYLDWSNPNNKEAIQFLHDLVQDGYTPIDQIADKYDQMNPKFNDGKYGSLFMWGLGGDYEKAGMLGEDKIHMNLVPSFNGQRYIFTDSWSYVLNSASNNKDAAIKFLSYMTSEEGMKINYECFDRYPARKDIAEKIVPDSDPAKAMYSQYAQCNVKGRPMLPQTMEFISAMGTIFQQCMQDQITVDDFCEKAAAYVEEYGSN